MRLGWKIFIPVTIVWIAVVGIAIFYSVGPWFDDIRQASAVVGFTMPVQA